MHGVSCKQHTTLEHFFETPLCKDRLLIKRICTIAFHILTLGIPFVVYKVFTACCMKQSEPNISPILDSEGKTTPSTRKFPHSELLANLLLEADQSLKVQFSGDDLGMSDNPSYEEIEKFTHSNKFKDLPPIVKIGLNWQGGGFQEIVLIKYTLFVPQEAGKAPIHSSQNAEGLARENDSIWHDYLLIRYNPAVEKWDIDDARRKDHLPNGLRKNNHCPMFTYQSYPALFTDLNDASIKKFLENQPVGLFRGHSPFLPAYIEGQTTNIFSRQRVFKDIPVTLGHISLEDVYKLLKVENHPDFVGKPDATIVPMKNPSSSKQVISF